MKICTITCHNVYNYGATLQTVALYQYLKSCGYEVEIIDYRPSWLNRRYNLWMRGGKWKRRSVFVQLLYYFLFVPLRHVKWKGMRRFDTYSLKNFKTTAREYHDFRELSLDTPIADVYIVGSDQVWNPETSGYFDPAFFLGFVPEGKIKLSYAASFGVSDIVPELRPILKSYLSSFTGISVRESIGLKILESSGIMNATTTVDPVFLLDSALWSSMAAKRVSDVPYLLVYDFENNPMIEKIVKNYAETNNYKIYSVNNYSKTHFADMDFNETGPDVFLSLIIHAESIFTNSFHATAFSIIFRKNFYVFNRIHSEINSRILNILELCNLSDRLITDDESIPAKVEDERFQDAISRLSPCIQASKDFLKTNIRSS